MEKKTKKIKERKLPLPALLVPDLDGEMRAITWGALDVIKREAVKRFVDEGMGGLIEGRQALRAMVEEIRNAPDHSEIKKELDDCKFKLGDCKERIRKLNAASKLAFGVGLLAGMAIGGWVHYFYPS